MTVYCVWFEGISKTVNDCILNIAAGDTLHILLFFMTFFLSFVFLAVDSVEIN